MAVDGAKEAIVRIGIPLSIKEVIVVEQRFADAHREARGIALIGPAGDPHPDLSFSTRPLMAQRRTLCDLGAAPLSAALSREPSICLDFTLPRLDVPPKRFMNECAFIH